MPVHSLKTPANSPVPIARVQGPVGRARAPGRGAWDAVGALRCFDVMIQMLTGTVTDRESQDYLSRGCLARSGIGNSTVIAVAGPDSNGIALAAASPFVIAATRSAFVFARFRDAV